METAFYVSLAINLIFGALLVWLVIKITSHSKAPTSCQNCLKEQKQNQKRASISKRLYNSSREDVEAFIKKSDWKTISNIADNFVPRVDFPHDNQVWKLLTDRLCQTEHPILSNEFMKRHRSEIIMVENNTSDAEIKKEVKQKWIDMGRPFYVVRSNHQLVGFALSSTLIIDGVTPRAIFASHIGKIVQSWNKSLLTKSDSKIVEKHFEALNSMMKEANVPHISHKNWMISTGDYEGYDLNHPKRFTYYEDDDVSLILAKL